MDISYLTSIVKIELALFESTSVAYISILQIITWSIKQNFETGFFVETLDLQFGLYLDLPVFLSTYEINLKLHQIKLTLS